MSSVWCRIYQKSGSFPVVCAFLLSLIGVQVLAFLGCVSFDNVLPWLLLIFFMYGFSEWHGEVRWVNTFFHVSELRSKVIAAFITVLIANGLYVEERLKYSEIRQIGASVLLIIVFYLFDFYFISQDKKGNLWTWSGAAIFAIFMSTGNLTTYDNFGWYGYISAFISWFILFGFALECCWKMSEKITLFKADRFNGNCWCWGIGVWIVAIGIDLIWLLGGCKLFCVYGK